MRIPGTGWTIRSPLTKAAAAPVPPSGVPNLANPLPPFGTNPARGPIAPAIGGLDGRETHSDPRELWYLALPAKLTPKQVLQILRAALGGDLWQQWQLLALMMDTWPMLNKCVHEVRSAVAGVKWAVHPYAEEGEKPTDTALEKRSLVRRAMTSFDPNPFTDERDFYGLAYDVTDAMMNGIGMCELMWQKSTLDGALLPRASVWVHPRNFTFDDNGALVVFGPSYNRLQWPLTSSQAGAVAVDPNKFICAQYGARSGSSLGAGKMRSLAWYWAAVMYNREWMLAFAKRYGNPFLEGTYKPGTPENEIAKLNDFLANGAVAGWASHPEGTTITVHPAQPMGADNAQVQMMKMADDACQVLLLGQTATTQGTPGKLGGEDAHESVKREVVEAVSGWTARTLTQFARAVLRVNYGNTDECPSIEADFTGAGDPMKEATRDAIFLTNGVPMKADDFYKRNNLEKPEEGDEVVVSGKLGVLGATDAEIDPNPPPPAPFGGGPEDFGGEDPGGDEPTDARLRATIKAATDEELRELATLGGKAAEAGHVNGEWGAVRIKVKQIQRRLPAPGRITTL